MYEEGGQLPWTEEQWATVQRTAVEAARRARVASSFLPLVGPLPESQASVPALTLGEDEDVLTERYRTAPKRLQVDDDVTLKLATLAVEVFVKTQQANDPNLASVLQMVSRAGVVVGRLEDAVVLLGQPELDQDGVPTWRPGDPVVEPVIYRVTGGQVLPGLTTASSLADIDVPGANTKDYGSNLVESVARAISELEGKGQYGPFGCVLGQDLYEAAHRPSEGSLVLPSDRFVPFLGGGPLLRSSVLDRDEGVIVATAGSPVDLVVASDVHVSFLQRTTEPRYVLRVSERMVLRIKQTDAVAHLVGIESESGPKTSPESKPEPAPEPKPETGPQAK